MAEELYSLAALDRPMDYGMMEAYLGALADTYALPVQVIGTSISGRAIRAVCLGDPRLQTDADKQACAAVYFGGMIEGDWVSTAILLRFLRDYCLFHAEGRRLYGVHLPYLWENRLIYVFPCIHPDGMRVRKGDKAVCTRPASMQLRDGFFPGAPFACAEGANPAPEVSAVCPFLQFTPTRLCLSLCTADAEPCLATVPDCAERTVTIGRLLSRMASYPFTRAARPGSLTAWYTTAIGRPAYTALLGRERSEVGYYYAYAAMREVLFSAPLLL